MLGNVTQNEVKKEEEIEKGEEQFWEDKG